MGCNGSPTAMSLTVIPVTDDMPKKTKPMTAESIKQRLRVGMHAFSFTTVNGIVYSTKGTLDFTIIPSDKYPKGKGKKTDAVIRYYDLERGEWRSFKPESFLGFVDFIRKNGVFY